MDPAWSVVVLLLGCVFGSPVPSLDVNREGVQPEDDRPIPIDSNSTGLYEDRYDENTTLLNSNSTGMSEDQYVDKSPLLDSISTGLYEDRYDENSTLADNKTGPYEDRYDENSTLADRNKTGDDDIFLDGDENSLLADRNNTGLAEENNDEINAQAGNFSRIVILLSMKEDYSVASRQEDHHKRCFLSTCLVHHLPNILQSGDETAGDRTKDIHGPG